MGGIKINGIISVTVNMSTRNCVFYATKESVRKTLAQSLRINGFQVQIEEEKEDDVASVHSGLSSMKDQNKAQLSSLMHDKNIPFTKSKSLHSNNSIIKERYDQNNEKENNHQSGPSYVDPKSFAASKNGITKYKPKQRAMSLAQRLEFEQKLKEDEEKQEQQTQSLLGRFVAYIW